MRRPFINYRHDCSDNTGGRCAKNRHASRACARHNTRHITREPFLSRMMNECKRPVIGIISEYWHIQKLHISYATYAACHVCPPMSRESQNHNRLSEKHARNGYCAHDECINCKERMYHLYNNRFVKPKRNAQNFQVSIPHCSREYRPMFIRLYSTGFGPRGTRICAACLVHIPSCVRYA